MPPKVRPLTARPRVELRGPKPRYADVSSAAPRRRVSAQQTRANVCPSRAEGHLLPRGRHLAMRSWRAPSSSRVEPHGRTQQAHVGSHRLPVMAVFNVLRCEGEVVSKK